MRAYVSRLLCMVFFFAVLAVGMNLLGRKLTQQNVMERNVVTGRINAKIQTEVDSGNRDAQAIVGKAFTQRMDEWRSLYGDKACPKEVQIHFFTEENETAGRDQSPGLKLGEDTSRICCLYEGERLIGLAEYRFKDFSYSQVLLLMNGCILISAILVILYGA